VASGWIAGERLMGIALVLWENGLELVRRLLGREARGSRRRHLRSNAPQQLQQHHASLRTTSAIKRSRFRAPSSF